MQASTYSGNYATSGGAIYVSMYGAVAMINCNLVGNHADEDGGAMYSNHTSISLNNCKLNENTASQGGAANIENTASVNVMYSSMIANTATLFGGGMHISTVASAKRDSSDGSDSMIMYSSFGEDSAGSGGGLYIFNQNANHKFIVTQSIFASNSADDGNGQYSSIKIR